MDYLIQKNKIDPRNIPFFFFIHYFKITTKYIYIPQNIYLNFNIYEEFCISKWKLAYHWMNFSISILAQGILPRFGIFRLLGVALLHTVLL